MKTIFKPIIGPYYEGNTIQSGQYVLFSSLLPNRTFSLNKTGFEVWKSIEKGLNINDIINNMCELYKSIDKDVISNDILKVIKKLWKNGFISFENENPFENDYIYDFNNDLLIKKNVFGLTTEYMKCINSNIHFFNNAYTPIEKLTDRNTINAELFYNINNIYVLLSKTKNDILAMISFSIDSFNGIVDINTLFFKSQENIMHEFIKKSIIVELGIRGINENEFNKYNILFHIISKKQDCIDLIQLGFENFTTLKQESKFGDIIVYKFHPHI